MNKHTGIPIANYTLMHADDVIATAHRNDNTVSVISPHKLPFGLRTSQLDYVTFMTWLNKRVDNLSRTYMNKVYIARKIGRDLENILHDSCSMSITDQFWVNRSDINTTWQKLQELRDQNKTLANVALLGNTANLNWDDVRQGTTSLFTTKGMFPKAILENHMLKLGGTSEKEWVATVIGHTLDIPVQSTQIINPSISNNRTHDGTYINPLTNTDDTLVKVALFTSNEVSLVHASELCDSPEFNNAQRDGQHHKYFYDKLPSENLKRDFERVLMLNWLISNHDMHSENFGCLYSPKTFALIGIPPSFDHNSADFDGTIPEIDVYDILEQNIHHHGNIITKIQNGKLEDALSEVNNWITPEQKDNVKTVGNELINIYNHSLRKTNAVQYQRNETFIFDNSDPSDSNDEPQY